MICEQYEEASRNLNEATEELKGSLVMIQKSPWRSADWRIVGALKCLAITRKYLDEILEPKSYNPIYQGRKDPILSPLGYCKACGSIWGVCLDCKWTLKDCECSSFQHCCLYRCDTILVRNSFPK